MKSLIQTLCVITLTIFICTSCTKNTGLSVKDLDNSMIESPQTQADIDRNKIIKYVKAKKLKGNFTSSGIFYVIDNPGQGLEKPTSDSDITAHYIGSLISGKVFDSSYERGDPLEVKLGEVIEGWQEAIGMLGKGGKGKFIIPSSLAYGDQQVGEFIAENSSLVYDIELLDFK